MNPSSRSQHYLHEEESLYQEEDWEESNRILQRELEEEAGSIYSKAVRLDFPKFDGEDPAG